MINLIYYYNYTIIIMIYKSVIRGSTLQEWNQQVINRKPRPYSQSERDQGGVTPLTHPLRSPDTIYLRRYIQTVTNNNKTTHLNAAPFALSSFYLNHYFANDLLICIWFNLKWFKIIFFFFSAASHSHSKLPCTEKLKHNYGRSRDFTDLLFIHL